MSINIEEKLQQLIKNTLEDLGIKSADLEVKLEHPANSEFGDFSCNVAMTSFQKTEFANPRKFAEAILSKIETDLPPYLTDVSIAGPGFINFKLSEKFLLDTLQQAVDQDKNFAKLPLGQDKQLMVEFAHPNTHKVFHIGHLRNISTGESLVRILENADYDVIRGNYQGDVGLHIAKCLYGIMSLDNYQQQLEKLTTVEDRATLIGKSYVAGSTAYKEDKDAKEVIHDLNYLIYASAQKWQLEENNKQPSSTDYLKFVRKDQQDKFEEVFDLWKMTRQWSLNLFEKIYARVGTHYDEYYFESMCLDGVDLAKDALKKKVLEESEGAVIFNGEKYGLDTRVFINSLGLPTYEGKELSLATIQFANHPHIERIIHVVAPEQTSFFKVMFKVEELLGIIKSPDQQYHKKYGFVNLKSGKMSSRTGNIVTGQALLDEAKEKIISNYPEVKDEIAEVLAVAAVKYSFLKVNTASDIAFDFDESISMEGNSGPYLVYSYVRSQSVIKKAQEKLSEVDLEGVKINQIGDPEKEVLRYIYQFPEVLKDAAILLEPHHIANYLYNLAQNFNSFYNKCSVINADSQEEMKLRLMITSAVGIIIQKGLYLLGIQTVEQM